MTAAQAQPKGRVDLDRTREYLRRLDLEYAADKVGEMVTEAVKNKQPVHRFLDTLLKEEIERREERRIKTSLRLSGLPTGQTLGSFDWSFQPSIERSRIETLATCEWIREQECVLLQGPPGVGKTHLSVALGVKAIENGFSVAFYRLEDLLHELKKDADRPFQKLRRKKYLKVALLVVDEVGFQELDRDEASLLFRLVSYRYQKSSMLITTNKAIKDWAEVLAGDVVMTTAFLDRILHRCHVINIKGRSYRLRGLEKLMK